MSSSEKVLKGEEDTNLVHFSPDYLDPLLVLYLGEEPRSQNRYLCNLTTD